MARNKTTVAVQITGDAKELRRAFGEAEEATGQFSKAFDRIKTAAAVAIPAAFAFSVKAASDLEQAVGAVERVFSDSSNEILRFADTAAKSVGLSERAFNELVTPLGAMLKNAGLEGKELADTTIELTQRAADMAAVFGGPVGDALGAITAAIRGERDPIERFGVSINEAAVKARALELGLVDSSGQVTDFGKKTATVELILEQTSSATGAFADEADTLAVRLQTAKAEMEDFAAEAGAQTLPMFADLTGEITNAATAFSDRFVPATVTATDGMTDLERAIDFMLGGETFTNVMDEWWRVNVLGTGRASGALQKLGPIVEHGQARWAGLGRALERSAAAANKASVAIASMGQAMVDALNPVTQLRHANERYNTALGRVRELEDDGQKGAREYADAQFELLEATAGVQAAHDRLDLSGVTEDTYNLAAAAGYTREQWEKLIGVFSGMDGARIDAATNATGGITVDSSGWNLSRFHDGGQFRAPVPGGEGLALLRDKEWIIPDELARANGSPAPLVEPSERATRGPAPSGPTITIGNVYGWDDFVTKVRDAGVDIRRLGIHG